MLAAGENTEDTAQDWLGEDKIRKNTVYSIMLDISACCATAFP